jgi:hypothetical protein
MSQIKLADAPGLPGSCPECGYHEAERDLDGDLRCIECDALIAFDPKQYH